MDPKVYDRLSAGFVTAINRLQNLVKVFGSECPKLLDRLCQIAGNFMTTQGSVVTAQREKKPYQCRVIRRRWFSTTIRWGCVC